MSILHGAILTILTILLAGMASSQHLLLAGGGLSIHSDFFWNRLIQLAVSDATSRHLATSQSVSRGVSLGGREGGRGAPWRIARQIPKEDGNPLPPPGTVGGKKEEVGGGRDGLFPRLMLNRNRTNPEPYCNTQGLHGTRIGVITAGRDDPQEAALAIIVITFN